MKLTREEIYGFVGSALLCLLLIGALSLIVLRTEIRAEAEGIAVDFGTVERAAGTEEPAPAGHASETPDVTPVPEVVPTPEPPTPTPPVITQTTEPTAAIEAERQRKEQDRRIEQEKREAERRRQEEEQRRRDAINRQMSDAFGAGNAAGGSQGSGESSAGNQGSTQSTASSDVSAGQSGVGSFDLKGRSTRGTLPRPAYNVQEEGTIVVEITVNPQGDVLQAEIRLRGTTIENAHMRRSAIEAARKTKFNGIPGEQNQIGTITYHYKLN
jgi:TonB family protein